MLRTKGGGKQDWETPDWLFAWISENYGPFHLDAAATAENAKCNVFYSKRQDGLIWDWQDRTFCNPPWGNIFPWAKKALDEYQRREVKSVLLLPSLWKATKAFRRIKMFPCFGIVELIPRIAYKGGGKSPNGTSMLLTFGYGEADQISLVDLTEWKKSYLSPIATLKSLEQIAFPVHSSKTANTSQRQFQMKRGPVVL